MWEPPSLIEVFCSNLLPVQPASRDRLFQTVSFSGSKERGLELGQGYLLVFRSKFHQ